MREALQGHGYTIREVSDGEDAVKRFKENRTIDLIIRLRDAEKERKGSLSLNTRLQKVREVLDRR